MPKYSYECERCGEFEIDQKMSDPTLKEHPGCGGKVQRLMSRSSFVLKGSGWYSDGYARVIDPDKGSSDV